MTTVAAPECLECKHLYDDEKPGLRCAAFPDGIPEPIIFGRSHREPYPEDNGIRFERASDEEIERRAKHRRQLYGYD